MEAAPACPWEAGAALSFAAQASRARVDQGVRATRRPMFETKSSSGTV